jgi:predicted aspartyl protease
MARNKKKGFQALTVKYSGKTNTLYSDLKVSLPYRPEDGNNIPNLLLDCKGIWDTGATSSVITKNIVDKLNLKPVSKTQVCGVNGKSVENVYLVNIHLPNKVALTYVTVTECKELIGGFDALVGMDIIGSGDFAVTNHEEKTTMTYRFPSVKEIDFVKQANILNSQLNIHSQKSKQSVRNKRKKERQNKKKNKKRK